MEQLIHDWLAASPADRSLSSLHRALVREGLDIPENTIRRWIGGAAVRQEHRAAVAKVLGVTEARIVLAAAGLGGEG